MSAGNYLAPGGAEFFGIRHWLPGGSGAASMQAVPFRICLPVDCESYAAIAADAGFDRDFEAWIPRPFDSDGWLASTALDETWTALGSASPFWERREAEPAAWSTTARQPETWTTE
jgi:hypothetical protein